MTVLRVALGLAAVVLGVLAYRVQVDELGSLTTPQRAVAIVAVAWTFVFAGLVAWVRRPANRLGPLMAAAGLALLLRQLRYSHDPLVFTVFFAVGEVGYALAAHSVLAYPSGRTYGRAERALVKVGYAAMLLFPLAILLVYDGTRPLRFMDPAPRESLIVVAGDGDLALLLQKIFVVFVWGVLATVFVGLLLRRLVRATPRARRLLAPLLLGAVVFALRAVFEGIFTFVERPSAVVYDYLLWWQLVGFVALPLALLAGMLRARLARAGIGELVLELERAPPHGFRDALARALGDPTLEVAFWLPERRGFVDAAGRHVELPAEDGRRAVTRIEHDGEPLAALVHDATLGDEPKLLHASGAAVRLALENAHLQAEMRAQLVRVQESRGRIVAAADEERRRIERDIHDGAQQRLVALGLQLRSAQRQLGSAAAPELDRLLAEAVDELQVAVEELRELARGVHPAILTEEGLAAALDSLGSRTPISVSLEVADGRLPPGVEATAYFVVCEALANVVKHAEATKATIRAERRNGILVVEVSDDGVGGAHAGSGSGLRGLADRVEALGGRLVIESPAGGGTRIVGEIPCES
jgi:signal transduction histidine kinase